MNINPQDYEKLGAFYLGREYNDNKLQDQLVMYDSRDLVTHGVVVGMTGSGKTGLCLSLLEEAAIDGIPAIVVDPKGDLGNLLLTFPNLSSEEFAPWVNEDEARRANMSTADYAVDQAEKWSKGLSEWGQDAERIKRFRDAADTAIFTPGSRAGIPVAVIRGLDAPPSEILEDVDMFNDQIESAVSSLLGLVGVTGEVAQSPEHVILSQIFQESWKRGQNLSLESIIAQIQRPTFDKVGVIDLETFYPAKKRTELALKFNTLLASPSFSSWREGMPMDLNKLLYTAKGKPRIAIFSIAHLSDPERMFFVATLLNATLSWMRQQKGTTSLRALFYMDELFGYLPPTANPPSKKPLMLLLKQGRAFGLGCLLASQNPVDLDYKALSNIGTWWIGRLQTDQDISHVANGIKDAVAKTMPDENIQALLAGLQNRVFLMHNVHEDGPVLLKVRWAMSYLSGPLTKDQIKMLMDSRREDFESQMIASTPSVVGTTSSDSDSEQSASSARPTLPVEAEEGFMPATAEGVINYRPYLLQVADIHYYAAKYNIDGAMAYSRLVPIEKSGVQFENSEEWTEDSSSIQSEPVVNSQFSELPAVAQRADFFKQASKELYDEIPRSHRARIWLADALDQHSEIDESEATFRVRLVQLSREKRDEVTKELQEKYAPKLRSLEERFRRAEMAVEKEKAESKSAWISTVVSAGASLLSGFLGRKSGLSATSIRGMGSTLSSGSRALKQQKDVTGANEKVEFVQQEIAALQAELQKEIETQSGVLDAEKIELEEIALRPLKKDIAVKQNRLLWLPHDDSGRPVY